jgi:hypothetical protein
MRVRVRNERFVRRSSVRQAHSRFESDVRGFRTPKRHRISMLQEIHSRVEPLLLARLQFERGGSTVKFGVRRIHEVAKAG